MENEYDVIIIGSGPAGLTAAIYTTRANLKTLIIAGRTWGGQLMLTTLVENFPGFPEGIMGPDLMSNMRKQAERHGAKILDINFSQADFSKKKLEIVADDDQKFYTKAVIIATGADTKWLGVPGEKELIGRGISSCAPCDGPFYRGKDVIVVGGGDSALEEANVLTRYANHIYLVHRRSAFRASAAMQDKVFANPKISVIWNSEILAITGDNKVEKARLSSNFPPKARLASGGKVKSSKLNMRSQNEEIEKTPEEMGGKIIEQKDNEIVWEMPIGGVFVAVGHLPNSQVFKGIEVDEKGFIKVFNHTKTNVNGVFVAGDVHDAEYKQAISAAGFGCMAALEVQKWLENKE